MYSQNKEEGVINSLFGNHGRFLDVGAFDGKTFSNTLRLFERGWTGVLIEPSPKAFKALRAQYNNISEDKIILINKAVGTDNKQIEFYESNGDAVSTTDIHHKEKWEKGYGSKFDKITIESITWSGVFNNYGTNFDFVNIDTESTNWELIKIFPFNICRPMCLCVEYDNKKKEIEELLKSMGYRTIYTSGENIVSYRGPK